MSEKPTEKEVAAAEELATDMERLLTPIMNILGSISHRNLTGKAITDFLVPRRYVLDLKAEIDRQYPGLYEHMRSIETKHKEQG